MVDTKVIIPSDVVLNVCRKKYLRQLYLKDEEVKETSDKLWFLNFTRSENTNTSRLRVTYTYGNVQSNH